MRAATILLSATAILSAWTVPSFAQDLTVEGSLCVGINCESAENFGLDTIRLKEQNLRIRFQDTSESPFPSNDWRLQANDSSSGGANYFSIVDITAGRTPFRVEAGAPSHSFRISATGDIGIRRFTPLQDFHIASTNTPTIRLQQDSSGGNPDQSWDVGGNDDNFFVRDADQDTLPFRIRPGAPTNALFVDANGQVGVGLQNPRGALHVRRNQPNNVPHLVLQNRREGGRTEIWFEDRDTATDDDALRLQLRDDEFNITFNGTGGAEFRVSKTGDVRIFRGDLVIPNGSVVVGGSTLNVPDYVFADDYELMPLGDVAAFIDEHAHLPHVPSAGEIAQNGLDMTAMQLAMLKSHEELVLHVIEMRELIEAQAHRIAVLEAERVATED